MNERRVLAHGVCVCVCVHLCLKKKDKQQGNWVCWCAGGGVRSSGLTQGGPAAAASGLQGAVQLQ